MKDDKNLEELSYSEMKKLSHKQRHDISSAGVKRVAKVKYDTVQTIKEFNDAEDHIARTIYPSRHAEKNRNIRAKKKMWISKWNIEEAFEELLKSRVKSINNTVDIEKLKKGQYLKHKHFDTLAKIVEIRNSKEFAIKFILEDSEYVWNFRFFKSFTRPGKYVIKVVYALKAPVSVEYASWRMAKGRFEYMFDTKSELKGLKQGVEEKWK